MRIHSNKLSAMHIIHALQDEKIAGRIAFTVHFKTIEKKGSRTHANAFEIQLSSSEKEAGDGRRAGNSGAYGAGDEYAATYDEWGFLLAALFELDLNAVVGSVKNPIYDGYGDFHKKTGLSYWRELADYLETGFDTYPYVSGKNSAGRRGYGRTRVAEYAKYEPRTADFARAFQKRG